MDPEVPLEVAHDLYLVLILSVDAGPKQVADLGEGRAPHAWMNPPRYRDRLRISSGDIYYIRLTGTNSFISVKVSSKSHFSFLSYALHKTVAETRQMMVFHHPLHVSLTVLQKTRLADCMFERSRLCRQIQLDSHQLPHHEASEPN